MEDPPKLFYNAANKETAALIDCGYLWLQALAHEKHQQVMSVFHPFEFLLLTLISGSCLEQMCQSVNSKKHMMATPKKVWELLWCVCLAYDSPLK